MTYTVQQLAKLASISVRTLHYYDEIGLLKPAFSKVNGYRYYEEKELQKLQQILFFRELEFPLEEINKIVNSPSYSAVQALRDHKKLLSVKKKRLDELLSTLDKTIKTMSNQKSNMNDEEYYGGFSKEEYEKYQQEAKDRWGNTDAYKQSQGKYEKLTKEEKIKMKEDIDRLNKALVAEMPKGIKHPDVQKLVQKHRDSINFFYNCTLKIYRGLAEMYVADPRFAATYNKYHPNLAQFLHDAMIYYCDTHEA